MDIILDLLKSAFNLLKKIADWLLGRFFDLNIFDRLLVASTAVAFFAIVLPIARYYIFDTWFIINNPLAVYMIGIVMLVFGSFYIPPLCLHHPYCNFPLLSWMGNLSSRSRRNFQGPL